MLVLDRATMKKAMSMTEAIEADREAYRLLSTQKCDIPLRGSVSVKSPEGHILFMYGAAEPADAVGVKVYAEYPGNINAHMPMASATMLLLDAKTGQPGALLDGTYLTQLRTGASSGVATDALARSDSHVFALFGAGRQALYQLLAVCAVRSIEQVRVFDPNPLRLQDFVAEATVAVPGLDIIGVSSAAEALSDTDIVTTVTTSHTAVFDGKLIEAGTHVNAIGSYTPEMAEIDPWLMCHADAIYVDTRSAALVESGDLTQPITRGDFSADEITGEIGELLGGEAKGRTSTSQITLFEAVGSAALDLVVGQRMVERAKALNLGQNIDLS
jgi:ornithine cyclodeaminase